MVFILFLILKDKLIDGLHRLPGSDVGSSPSIMYINSLIEKSMYGAAGCDEQCSLHGGVCDNGVCEFRCSDYAGYTCQNSSALISSLALCGDVLVSDAQGQHCAPSENSILQQLEAAVVTPNYNRLIPSSRPILNIFDNGYCAAAAKRLACWVSVHVLFQIVSSI